MVRSLYFFFFFERREKAYNDGYVAIESPSMSTSVTNTGLGGQPVFSDFYANSVRCVSVLLFFPFYIDEE